MHQQPPRDAAAIVDDIRTLHELLTPVRVIARKLHLSQQTVRHVIQHGRLPAGQPQWQRLAAPR